MGSMPLALSVHNFISSVGADAGFASIIGLAILVLLYFAHARETANLREEAAGLTERLRQAEAQVAHLSRVQPAAVAAAGQSGHPAQPIVAPAPSLAAAAFPFAPPGVGAPALAAATRVVPVARRPVPKPPVAVPALAAAMSAATPAAPTAPGPESPAPERVAAPAPATVAGGNGSGRDAVVAAPVGAGPTPPSARVPTRAAGAPAAARRQPPPLRPPAARRSSGGRRLALLIGALGIIAVIAVLLIATSSGGSGAKTSSTRSARTTNAPSAGRSPAPAAFNPASVTVAVLNGTATNHLAHTVSAKLTGVGYKQGNVVTASNQTQTSTVVAYLPGAQNRTAAIHVAAALKLGSGSVQPIDQSTQQVACPPPQACTANVVVTVGADLATL
jgi:hypothetical protein